MSKKHDLAVAQILKAGTRTIVNWLGPDFEIVENKDALDVSRRVAFIRHPIERLKSCYSFYYWITENGVVHEMKAPLDSWESFVDYTLANDDRHWNPQADIINGTANIVHRFENLDQHWETYKPGVMHWFNKSSRRPTSDHRQDDLLNKYAEDLQLWSDAT